MTRHFLFLQGNSSHFFTALGRALVARGYEVSRINMCGGDRFFWGSWNAVDFRGAPADFGAFVREMVVRSGVTDIVLHNDCRPGHRRAIEALRPLDCRIWVFEEGYMRPHWLTLEEGGINGFSPLMSRMKDRLAGANDNASEDEAFVSLPPGMRRRVIYDFQWQIWNYLLWFRYPRFRTHRPFPIWAEYATWARRLIAMPWRRRHARQVIDRITASGEEYFVFAMQLDTDSQVVVHSRFAGMSEALNEVIASFAAHAPSGSRLVVKAHPLDNGWTNFRRVTVSLAHRYGVAGRVDYIDGGDLRLLVSRARGMVTLNSTAGFAALEAERPVLCLGKAIFDWPGLTCQGGLAAFWKSPAPPKKDLFSAFLGHLRRESLINGDYYSKEGVQLAVGNAIKRFEAPRHDGAGRSIGRIDALDEGDNGAELPQTGEITAMRQHGRREAASGPGALG